MKPSILVATSTLGFGELITQTFNELGDVQAVLAVSAAETLKFIQQKNFEVAILDVEMEDLSFLETVQYLRKNSPDVRLIVIPPDNDVNHPLLTGLQPDGFLSKPFYLPDLVDTIKDVLKAKMIAKKPIHLGVPDQQVDVNHLVKENLALPAWLSDVSRAARLLASLSLESSAQAALIIRDQTLWAYAGHLSQKEADELVQTINIYWSRDLSSKNSKGDLARFARLSLGGEYMLYATSLAKGLVLALAFDVMTPFSRIRAQAGQLAKALASPPDSVKEQALAEPVKIVDHPQAENTLPDIPDFQLVLPGNDPLGQFLEQEVDGAAREDADPEAAPVEEIFEHTESGESSHRVLSEWVPLSETGMAQKPMGPMPIKPFNRYTLDQLDFHSPTPTLANLAYAGMIIPRMPQHLIRGDLAEKLTAWVSQIFLAFAWKLDSIRVHEEYLLFVAKVSPSTSPSYLMRIIRQHTSQRIFSDFPGLADDNPSGDFWAPGYLIMSSMEPPPQPVIEDFILQTRRYQGISD